MTLGMRNRDLLKRLDRHLDRIDRHMERGDRHMERGNELMERSDALMERGNVLMEAVQEELRLAREQHADLRNFIREMNLRADRFTQAVVDSLNAVSADLRDLREESGAQRQALLLVLDRLDPGRPSS